MCPDGFQCCSLCAKGSVLPGGELPGGIEWILSFHAASSQPIRRTWSAVPYGEEEITRMEEELLPAMVALLERVGEIDRRLEGSQPEAGQSVASWVQ